MNRALIEAAISKPSDESIQSLLEEESTVFWVDWREEDDAIVEYCESILSTGTLSAEVVDADHDGGFDIYVTYKKRRGRIPLIYDAADRHITVLALNAMLRPDYEVRYCIDSNGSDSGAFLPLACAEWSEFESKFGDQLSSRFYRIKKHPNLFTDSLSF